jgi:SAM-dependent methyltransferase
MDRQSLNEAPECELVRTRYNRRRSIPSDLYSPLAPDVIMSQQEKARAITRVFSHIGIIPLADRKLLEIGCGTGNNLQFFISLGFLPANLVGNELLEERVEEARNRLPGAVKLIPGDASRLELPDNSFDIVFQSTVFTSILDMGFRMRLAKKMWQLLKPGGWILWYDFAYNNPHNSDVRGVPFKEISNLFPDGKVIGRRITLAPPIARRVTPVHLGLYTLLNTFSFLRTHWLCWIKKETE